MRKIPSVVIATALLVAPITVAAGEIIRATDSTGRVIYSDRVLPGTRVLERTAIQPPPPAPAIARPAAPQAGIERANAAAPRPANRSAELDAAIFDIDSAKFALDAARSRLEQGQEPLPGERLGNAGGGSRLVPEYFERIERLERDVERAEQRLREAWDRRNGLRG